MTSNDLQAAIAYIYPAVKYPGSYTMVVDVTNNATIGLWDNTVGIQPTVDQLAAASLALQLNPAKLTQIATLETAYATARYGTPVTITSAASASLTFPTDTYTQSNVIGYLVAYDATDWPSTNVPLQDASGAIQMLAFADMKLLAKTIADSSMTVWQHLMTLLGQVEAATTVAAVQAIVW
jgi:hypothetical protein